MVQEKWHMQNRAYTTISRGGQVSCYFSSQAVVPSFQVTGRYQGLDITYLDLNHVLNCSILFCKREAIFSSFSRWIQHVEARLVPVLNYMIGYVYPGWAAPYFQVAQEIQHGHRHRE